MTSKTAEFVVFVHLDGQCDAVPAGTLNMVEAEAEILQSTFGYGQRYVERTRALEMDPLTLALPGAGVDVLREPPNARGVALTEFGAFRDAAPDHWGRRVIENKLRRTGPLPESVYLQHGGTNRTGALDFRADPKSLGQPSPLSQLIDLQHLQEAAERIDNGEKIPAHLEMIFDAGATMGGARPKAVIEADDRQWVAKFAMPADKFAVPSVEFAALRMAKAARLNVPDIRMEDFGAKKSAMLIERFDRHRVKAGYTRYHFLSALTLLQYNEYESRHATYTEISQAIATYCVAEHVKECQAELFGRMVFNILVHNNDDHLRNHGFIYDAEKHGWRLSPLYDVLPAPSGSHERFLHLGVGSEGRSATLTNAMTKHGAFGLHRAQAIEIVERISSIVREWKGYFEDAGISGKDIDAVSSAFRRPRDIGLDSLS